jgi:hypothetical protein
MTPCGGASDRAGGSEGEGDGGAYFGDEAGL